MPGEGRCFGDYPGTCVPCMAAPLGLASRVWLLPWNLRPVYGYSPGTCVPCGYGIPSPALRPRGPRWSPSLESRPPSAGQVTRRVSTPPKSAQLQVDFSLAPDHTLSDIVASRLLTYPRECVRVGRSFRRSSLPSWANSEVNRSQKTAVRHGGCSSTSTRV